MSAEIVTENLERPDAPSQEDGRTSCIIGFVRVQLQDAPANDGGHEEAHGSDPQCPTCRVVDEDEET